MAECLPRTSSFFCLLLQIMTGGRLVSIPLLRFRVFLIVIRYSDFRLERLVAGVFL